VERRTNKQTYVVITIAQQTTLIVGNAHLVESSSPIEVYM